MSYQESPIICPVCQEKAEFKFVQDYKNEEGEWSLYECSECQVQFWMPFENPQAERYEKKVDYTSKLEIMTKENCLLIVRDYWNMNQFLKYPPYKNPNEKKLLDLGCGTGEFLFVMQNLGYEVYGVDFNQKAINVAKNYLGIENVYPDDVINFLENQKERYDVITAFEIIEHLDNPKKLLELVHRALKPGGYFAFSVPNRERYFGKINPETEKWDLPHQHLSRWGFNSLKDFISHFSFKIIKTKKEIPISWFNSRLRVLIESIMRKKEVKSSVGPIEKFRSNVGLKKYKSIKFLIKIITYPLALFLFYLLKFEGADLYVLAKKKC